MKSKAKWQVRLGQEESRATEQVTLGRRKSRARVSGKVWAGEKQSHQAGNVGAGEKVGAEEKQGQRASHTWARGESRAIEQGSHLGWGKVGPQSRSHLG